MSVNNDRLRYLLFVWFARALFGLCLFLMINGHEMSAYTVGVIGVLFLGITEKLTREK